MLVSSRLVSLLALGLVLSCTSQGPTDVTANVNQVGGPYDTASTRQSETAIVASRSFIFPVLVTAFNDYSVASTGVPEFDANFYRRGVSLMGWSTSGDVGTTWDYRGKLRPPPGWSALWGDPSLAVDPNQPNVVYYAQMGISDARWNIQAGGADEIPRLSFVPNVDGICVAKSTDGGVTFGAPSCFESSFSTSLPLSNQVVDRTSIVVDGTGAVYVAFIDAVPLPGTRRVRVYRTNVAGDLATFSALPDPPFGGQSTPRLVWESGQRVWVGSLASTVKLSRYDGTTWATVDASALCGVPPTGVQDDVAFASTRLRTGHEYDFSIGFRSSTSLVVGVVFQLARPSDPQARFLQLGFLTSLGSCTTSPALSTIQAPGTQLMPSLNYKTRRTSTQPGGLDPEWWLSYYTTEGVVDSADKYLRVEAQRVQFDGIAGLQFATFLTPPDWYACPTNPTVDQGGYWGDYFDLTQVQDLQGAWWSVAAFTSSRPAPPCTGNGLPQHVAASRW